MKIDTDILPEDRNGIVGFTVLRESLSLSDPYEGNNICDYTGDSFMHFLQNRMELSHYIGVPTINLIQPQQVHGANVRIVTDPRTPNLKTDAVVTQVPGLILGVNTADCVPILFSDPVHKVIAAAHAGWRGTALNIVAATIDAMKSLGTRPADLLIGIGAAICKEVYEVGDEVVEAIEKTGLAADSFASRNPKTGKYHVDLREANRLQLLAQGVYDFDIKVSTDCTYSSPEKYYSARRLGKNSGRTYTAIAIAP